MCQKHSENRESLKPWAENPSGLWLKVAYNDDLTIDTVSIADSKGKSIELQRDPDDADKWCLP